MTEPDTYSESARRARSKKLLAMKALDIEYLTADTLHITLHQKFHGRRLALDIFGNEFRCNL